MSTINDETDADFSDLLSDIDSMLAPTTKKPLVEFATREEHFLYHIDNKGADMFRILVHWIKLQMSMFRHYKKEGVTLSRDAYPERKILDEYGFARLCLKFGLIMYLHSWFNHAPKGLHPYPCNMDTIIDALVQRDDVKKAIQSV